MLSLLLDAWVWVMVFSISSPTTKRTFHVRFKAALMVECGMWLLIIIFNSTSMYHLTRLWRQPQGRQGSHDVPSMELLRLGQEP
jgi:hypothetical protein